MAIAYLSLTGALTIINITPGCESGMLLCLGCNGTNKGNIFANHLYAYIKTRFNGVA